MMCHCGNTTRLICMLGLVAVYFVVELIVGYVVNSIALVADAFHMLSDFFALLIGLVAIRISKWPQSSKNTFGWQRAEVMGGLVNTVILVTLCFTIVLRAIERFITPDKINNPRLMTYVGSGGLFINMLGLMVLGFHSHGGSEEILEVSENDILLSNDVGVTLNQGSYYANSSTILPDGSVVNDTEVSNNHVHKQTEVSKKNSHSSKSMNMRAVFLHVLADFFGSIVVVISAIVLEFAPGDPDTDGSWKLYIDPAMSVVMVMFILISTIKLMYYATLILLQSVPQEICLKNLKSRLEAIHGIHKVHDLHVWRLQSNCIIGSVHIRCENLPDYLKIAREVKQLFHDFNIHCTTIQPEFEEYPEDVDQGQINYQACVLDCGPNKSCQSDTCCPAAPTGSSIATYSVSSQSMGMTNNNRTEDPQQQPNPPSFLIPVTTTATTDVRLVNPDTSLPSCLNDTAATV